MNQPDARVEISCRVDGGGGEGEDGRALVAAGDVAGDPIGVGGVEVVPRPAPPAGGRRAERRSEGGGGVPAWVWIAGGVVVAAGAATAGVLIASPSEAREGTWGRAELGQ